MTRLVNDPADFPREALDGFVLAHRESIETVDGGVVRAAPLRDGQTALVVGGGSGHYPAFAGVVGSGLAAGAVCGNIFSSPSAAQAYRVAKAAEAGGGVLFSYGNYAGDVLHFGQAEERLRAEGLDVRTVLVTDDVASAPPEEAEKRRGIAGDFAVFKIAGAAAERGDSLDEVERLARKANARTRTIGAAFGGCTLPGADGPLFTVPDGQMSIGLGIHGEPGIRDLPMGTAAELAGIFVDALLPERPDETATRVAVILNGLGTVKYEELFVLYGTVARLLEASGLTVVDPEVGELVTSLDMAGVSLTLCWLDDELELLWRAPADSPAYRKNGVPVDRADSPAPTRQRPAASAAATAGRTAEPVAGPASVRAAAAATGLLRRIATALEAAEGELGRLDAVAGDGDHGIGMVRGIRAAVGQAAAQPADAGVRTLLTDAGDAWAEQAGGTSGALWGAAITAAATALGDRDQYDATAALAAARAAVDAVRRLGKAQPGDKTMVDAMVPALDTFEAALGAGRTLPEALTAAADAAQTAADGTAALTPKLGRARPLAAKSVGHPDPGAISFALIVRTIAEAAG